MISSTSKHIASNVAHMFLAQATPLSMKSILNKNDSYEIGFFDLYFLRGKTEDIILLT